MVTVETLCAPLFVPANRPERFEKAARSGADAVILDLEDAVATDAKDTARAALRTDFTDLPVIVRINPAGTPWHEADLAALRTLPIAAILLPKAESGTSLNSIAANFMGHAPIIALVETARGIADARAIAATPNVARLAFGSVDYCADLGCEHLREVLLPARSEVVMASRLAGITAPIDGVTTALDDLSITASDTQHARALGMTAKLCIHPKQVSEVMRNFAPSAAELDWALRVLASGDGAVSVDGAMVDEPVRIKARALIARSRK